MSRLSELIAIGKNDKVAMVRWHIAMILGYLVKYEDRIDEICSGLIDFLHDGSVFVRSWAIVSLCIVGRKYPAAGDDIIGEVSPLQWDNSIAIRSKARKALDILTGDDVPFPQGWIKSEYSL